MRLIDADVAIEELTDRSRQAAKRVGTDSPFWEGLVIARRIVNNLPTIQPEPTDEQVAEYCKRRCLHVVTDDFFRAAQLEPKWIPVSERLPETGVEVLTYDEALNYIEIQTLEDGRWENQRGDWQDLDDIAAWMPLPEPYQKGAIE